MKRKTLTKRHLGFEQLERRRMLTVPIVLAIDPNTMLRGGEVIETGSVKIGATVQGVTTANPYTNYRLDAIWKPVGLNLIDHDITRQLTVTKQFTIPTANGPLALTVAPSYVTDIENDMVGKDTLWRLYFALDYRDQNNNEHVVKSDTYEFIVYSASSDGPRFNQNTIVSPASQLDGQQVLVTNGATVTLQNGPVTPTTLDLVNGSVLGNASIQSGTISLQSGLVTDPVLPTGTNGVDLTSISGSNELDLDTATSATGPINVFQSGTVLNIFANVTTTLSMDLNLTTSASAIAIQGASGMNVAQSTICTGITGEAGSTITYSASNPNWIWQGGIANVLPLSSFFNNPAVIGSPAYPPEFNGNINAGSNGIDIQDWQILEGTDTYSGGTIIETGGYLGIGSDAALGATSGALTMHNASYLQAVNSLTLSGSRSIVTADSGGLIQIDNDCNSLTIQSVISGSGGVVFSNGGTTTISGHNTYTGPTYVTSGCTLVIAAGGSLAGPVILEGGNLVVNTAGGLADGSSLTVGDPSAFQTSQQHMVIFTPQQVAAAAAKRNAMHALLNAWHAAANTIQDTEAKMLSPTAGSYAQLSTAQQNAVFMGNINAEISAILGPNLTGSGSTPKSVDAAMAIFWSNLGRKVSVSSGAVSAATVFSNPTNDPILAFDNLEMAWLATHTVSA